MFHSCVQLYRHAALLYRPPYANEATCELNMAVAGVHFGNTNSSIAVCKVSIVVFFAGYSSYSETHIYFMSCASDL